MKKIVTTAREIIASFAYCIIKGSPYSKVENLTEILEDIRVHLIPTFDDENKYIDKYNGNLYKEISIDELRSIFKNIKNIPSFSKLNLTKYEIDKGFTDANDDARPVKFGVSGRGITNQRDKDFIDLDACIRNVLNLLLIIN